MIVWKHLLCRIFGHRYAKVKNPPYADAGPACEFAGCARCRELFVLNHDVGVILEFWRVAHLYKEREERRNRCGIRYPDDFGPGSIHAKTLAKDCAQQDGRAT